MLRRTFFAVLLSVSLLQAFPIARITRAELQFSQDPTFELLVPDLQPLPPFDLRLEIRSGGAQKLLRFSTSIWNRGPVALELNGWRDRFRGVIQVRQRLFSADGSHLSEPAGEFIYHSKHEHWHWDGFASYEVRSLEPGGRAGDVLADSGKVGFCLRDDDRMPGNRLGYPIPAEVDSQDNARYGECRWQVQGLSPGWIDTYGYQLDGQSLDISALADGAYMLVTKVDPADILQEQDETNNNVVIYFGIYGSQLVVFGISPPVGQSRREGFKFNLQ